MYDYAIMERGGHHIARRTMLAAGLAAASSVVLNYYDRGSSAASHNVLDEALSPQIPPVAEATSPAIALPTTEPFPTETPTSSATSTTNNEQAITAKTDLSANFAPENLSKYLPRNHFIQEGPTDEPYLSITIDDFFGVQAAIYLKEVLDIGKKRNVKFTFFPTGAALDTHRRAGYSDVWRRAVDEGHVIGNHTYHHYIRPDWPHKAFGLLQPEEIHSELELSRQALYNVLGYKYPLYLMRPPGGSGGFPEAKREHAYALGEVTKEGYYMTMWTADSNTADGRIVTAHEDERFLNKLLVDPKQKVGNGAIVLLHPTTLSPTGIESLIKGVYAQGIGCRTIPELLSRGRNAK